jgi:hypothetical protein
LHFEQWPHIKPADFPVCILNVDMKIWCGAYLDNVTQHGFSLLKWGDSEWFITIDRQFPVHKQVFLMYQLLRCFGCGSCGISKRWEGGSLETIKHIVAAVMGVTRLSWRACGQTPCRSLCLSPPLNDSNCHGARAGIQLLQRI